MVVLLSGAETPTGNRTNANSGLSIGQGDQERPQLMWAVGPKSPSGKRGVELGFCAHPGNHLSLGHSCTGGGGWGGSGEATATAVFLQGNCKQEGERAKK